mmetsp:Transcript_52511/g.103625  ORF Transcript_52511/g.103625 Transcript_52511/m.103625 type:complete len:156 (+) Transcript_52511:105-572(+)
MSARELCEATVREFIASNGKIRSMVGSATIICTQCDQANTRAYITSESEIVLCTNKLSTQRQIKEALTHESVHSYDYANNRCDFSTCEGLAYTEIRAAVHAECAGSYPFEWFREQCIKKVATSATANMYPKNAAKECVVAMFKKAVSDSREKDMP